MLSVLRARCAIASGASTFTPQASNTSAEPHREETDRLPCFTTGRPQAAATTAAAVEILSVPWPSPPVPQQSATSIPPVSNGTAPSRSARAAPLTSCGRSP